jgi:hypothetical protein
MLGMANLISIDSLAPKKKSSTKRQAIYFFKLLTAHIVLAIMPGKV